MSEELFGNKSIISWLEYYNDNTQVDLEKVKILDITRKNKNLIPAVEANECVMVFTEAGHHDIFYRMWDVGLGECEVWYNEGSEPSGRIKHDKIKDMINRGINASAAMLIINKNACNTYKIGMKNASFSKGSVQYVGSELRAIILNKMHVSYGDNICIISGESIAVETAIIAGEGHVTAVEYSARDRETLEENVDKFGINNVTIIDHVDDEVMSGLPVPSLTMLVASASMEQEIRCLLKLNPQMEFVIYTLDFKMAASIPQLFEKYGIRDMEMIQVAVSKMDPSNMFHTEPAPWIITGKAVQ
ncbi:MAG: precorrin-6B methylase [Parasporobacterium sp.]|nr:precorrin-6B methylase [Parasporobacterium sp.]